MPPSSGAGARRRAQLRLTKAMWVLLALLLAALPSTPAAPAPPPPPLCSGLAVQLYNWSDATTAQALTTQNRASVTPILYTLPDVNIGIKSPPTTTTAYSWAPLTRSTNVNQYFSMVISGYLQVR